MVSTSNLNLVYLFNFENYKFIFWWVQWEEWEPVVENWFDLKAKISYAYLFSRNDQPVQLLNRFDWSVVWHPNDFIKLKKIGYGKWLILFSKWWTGLTIWTNRLSSTGSILSQKEYSNKLRIIDLLHENLIVEPVKLLIELDEPVQTNSLDFICTFNKFVVVK